MKTLTVLIASLFMAGIAEAQVACFQYSGGVVSCDGPSGNTTIAPLTQNRGVITEVMPIRLTPVLRENPRSVGVYGLWHPSPLGLVELIG